MGTAFCSGYLLNTDYNMAGIVAPFSALCISVLIFLLLYFYFDNVLPDEYGVRKEFLFCCKRKKNRKFHSNYTKMKL